MKGETTTRRQTSSHWTTPLRMWTRTMRIMSSTMRTMRINSEMPRGIGCTFPLSRGHQLGTYVTSQLGCPVSQTVKLVGQPFDFCADRHLCAKPLTPLRHLIQWLV